MSGAGSDPRTRRLAPGRLSYWKLVVIALCFSVPIAMMLYVALPLVIRDPADVPLHLIAGVALGTILFSALLTLMALRAK